MSKKIDRLGETKLNNQDLKMTIIVYRNSGNIDVQFEDGTIVEHRTYDGFKKGKIRHPNYQLKKTHEQFIKELNKKNKNAEYIEFLSKYNGYDESIECECKICGHKWSVLPFNLLYGYDCPKCAVRKQHDLQRKTHEQFIKEFYEKNSHANDIEILGIYEGNDIPIHCRCRIDGHEWFPMPYTLLQNHGCLECAIRNNRGENSPRWNPNITQEEREQGRGYYEYNEFTRKVYERDNYTCQVTGQRGGKLVVHHLYGYNKYKCLRTVVENGITLSKEVHDLFHSIYGKGNNTLEQWEEFINNRKDNEVA